MELTHSSLALVVDQFIEKGRSWPVKWDEQRALAWKSVEQRLDSLEAGNGQQFAAVPEILCAAHSTGPSPVPGLDLTRIPLDVWTSILLDTIAPSTAEPGQDAVPPWLATFALSHVGAHTLMQAIFERLCGALFTTQLSATLRARATSGAQPQGSSAQVALVVRNSMRSITSGWTTPPTLGMAWVVDVHRFIMRQPLKLLKTGLSDRPVLLVWEEPADVPDLQKEVLEAHLRSEADRVQVLYMYPRAQLEAKSPAVVDPSGPDALFRRARSNERPSP